uniref:MSP domain-containing protein n=1 Tax=Strongyloides venezuelensis TaxID=75913 RepID=A0A0K0G666_STRVS
MISKNEYSNMRLIFDNEIYEIKCLMDLTNVANYKKQRYNKYEKRPIFVSYNSIRIKPTSLNIFDGIISKKYNEETSYNSDIQIKPPTCGNEESSTSNTS